MLRTLLSPVGPLHVPLDGAVHLDVRARDVRVLVRDEEGDDGGHVLHLAAPPRRDALCDQVAVVVQADTEMMIQIEWSIRIWPGNSSLFHDSP